MHSGESGRQTLVRDEMPLYATGMSEYGRAKVPLGRKSNGTSGLLRLENTRVENLTLTGAFYSEWLNLPCWMYALNCGMLHMHGPGFLKLTDSYGT